MLVYRRFRKARLVESLTAVIIPLDDSVLFVRLFNCSQLASGYSEVAQALDRDLRDLVLRQSQTVLRAVASGHGLSQQSLRGATEACCGALRSLGIGLFIGLLFDVSFEDI
jgi:hypothetical protein